MGLVEGSTTKLTISDTSAGIHGGNIQIDGTVVATPDPSTGAYVGTVDCRSSRRFHRK